MRGHALGRIVGTPANPTTPFSWGLLPVVVVERLELCTIIFYW